MKIVGTVIQHLCQISVLNQSLLTHFELCMLLECQFLVGWKLFSDSGCGLCTTWKQPTRSLTLSLFTHSLTKKIDLFRKGSIVPLGWTVDGQLAFKIPGIVAHRGVLHLKTLHFLRPGNAANHTNTVGKTEKNVQNKRVFKVNGKG